MLRLFMLMVVLFLQPKKLLGRHNYVAVDVVLQML